MIVRHLTSVGNAEKEVDQELGFLLRSGTLDYLSLYPSQTTRYAGWFVWRESQGGHFVKILEHIQPLTAKGDIDAVVGLTLTEFQAVWELASGAKLAFVPLRGRSGVHIMASTPTRLRILLDPRHTYRHPSLVEREITTSLQGTSLSVMVSDPNLEAPIAINVRSSGGLTLIEQATTVNYSRDAARHSPPESKEVLILAETTTTSLMLGAADNLNLAEQYSLQAGQQQFMIPAELSVDHGRPVELPHIAERAALSTLERLRTPTGFWAGLPWFHQQWTRDTLVAALGMRRDDQFECIQHAIGMRLDNGQLPTYIGSNSSCSDGLLWLCLLVREYGLNDLDPVTQARLEHLLIQAHTELSMRRAHHGLIESGKNATWMDTPGREGFPIEIQAGFLLALELLYELTFDPRVASERLQLRSVIEKEYLQQGMLADRLGDPICRPNLFIAYLAAPDLLSEISWRSVFTHALEKLWLPWGGLSTIDTSNPAFHAVSMGESNESYHNGDSWMMINCLASVALKRFGGFAAQASQLVSGATEEILWKNIAGAAGETQAAGNGDSWGCGVQAFSAGPYLWALKEHELSLKK